MYKWKRNSHSSNTVFETILLTNYLDHTYFCVTKHIFYRRDYACFLEPPDEIGSPAISKKHPNLYYTCYAYVV